MAASTHTVESTPETVRSGYLDPAAKPVAVITSGDTVRAAQGGARGHPQERVPGGYQGPGGTVAAAVTLTAADRLAATRRPGRTARFCGAVSPHWSGWTWSGWPDSNRRPPRPKRGALAKLRYSPYARKSSVARQHR